MKRILLIATGGTIATQETAQGLTPALDSASLLGAIPEIAGICKADALQLILLDSTNINYNHWLRIASCIRSNYALYDGFVITHGTDTMAYTAAALSYLIAQSPKPIVITGAQQSICNRDSDARRNLLDAFRYAVSEYASGVHLVFDGQVIVGTRARKVRTMSRNAFLSVDYPPTAIIRDDRVICYIDDRVHASEPLFSEALQPSVFVWKLIPGPDAALFPFIRQHYQALVIESFGVGGIPCAQDRNFLDGIADLVAHQKTVVITTQVQHEGSDLSRYRVGYLIKEKYEVLEAYTMTLEAVVTKLMWILAKTHDPSSIRELFYRPIHHDLII
jgi:L-asparaginase